MDREKLVVTAYEAVGMLLWMGKESYRQDVLDDPTCSASVSPLAGWDFRTTLLESMCVGPANPPANVHIALRIGVFGLTSEVRVEAYCQVTCDDRRPYYIEAHLYVDGEYAVRRNVSMEQNGSLRPWGMPPGLSVTCPADSTALCDTCGIVVVYAKPQGRYYVNVADVSVTNADVVVAQSNPSTLHYVAVTHLPDGRHVIAKR